MARETSIWQALSIVALHDCLFDGLDNPAPTQSPGRDPVDVDPHRLGRPQGQIDVPDAVILVGHPVALVDRLAIGAEARFEGVSEFLDP